LLRSIRRKQKVDQTFDIDYRKFDVKFPNLEYIDEYIYDKNEFVKTTEFMTMSLDKLLEVYTEFTSINASFKFYDKKSEKEKIDNPLKVLDFIKDIYKPLPDRIIDPKQEKINDKFAKLQAAMERFNNLLQNRSAE
jgi:hypothetical protein